MTPTQFYEDLLKQIAVPRADIDASRKKRDELGQVMLRAVGGQFQGASFYPAGALAAGTQIRPLNDVDVVLELPTVPHDWVDYPQRAMLAVEEMLKGEIRGKFELTTHAIKITYPDEDFTADVVVGWRQKDGILIPECPKEGKNRWIATHPKRHAEQVRQRNTDFGSAIFSQEIRVLKYLNREWKLQDDQERKPLSSFHVTALALEILRSRSSIAEMTPIFLEKAAKLVLKPLPDPAGVGEPLEAKDPAYASGLLAEAGKKTRRALSVSPEEAERLLREVFGKPSEREALLGPGPVSVSTSGALIPGVAGERVVATVRSHGESTPS
jgi:hypothetical protein